MIATNNSFKFEKNYHISCIQNKKLKLNYPFEIFLFFYIKRLKWNNFLYVQLYKILYNIAILSWQNDNIDKYMKKNILRIHMFIRANKIILFLSDQYHRPIITYFPQFFILLSSKNNIQYIKI